MSPVPARRIGLSLALLLLAAPPPQAAPAERHLRLVYDFYAGGFRVGSVSAEARLAGTRYAAEARFLTDGSLASLFPIDFQFAATGTRAGHVTRPSLFQSVYGGFEGDPAIIVTYSDGAAPDRVEPGLPPGVALGDIAVGGRLIDPVSAAVEAFTRVGPEACGRTIRIFDGMRTYSLRLEEAGHDPLEPFAGSVFQGTAVRCAWRYRLDASAKGDWAGELLGEHPPEGDIWFAPAADGSVMVPVKFLARTPVIGVVVHLMRVEGDGVPVPLAPADVPPPEQY